MELSHNDTSLHSPAAKKLAEILRKRRENCNLELSDFERIESELHEQISALEYELISEELARDHSHSSQYQQTAEICVGY